MHDGIPVVLICGDGGSGKDTVAKLIQQIWGLPYKSSTSYVAAQMMWPQVQQGVFETEFAWKDSIERDAFKDLDDFYNQRSNHRRFWADWIDRYNRLSISGAQLYIDSVKAGNHILTGLRKVHEVTAFQATGIPDLSIWVDRPGISRDPTQEYGPELCDFSLRNVDLSRLTDSIMNLKKFINIAIDESRN